VDSAGSIYTVALLAASFLTWAKLVRQGRLTGILRSLEVPAPAGLLRRRAAVLTGVVFVWLLVPAVVLELAGRPDQATVEHAMATGIALAAMLVAGVVLPFAAHSAEPGMLDRLERGAWDLRIRDDGTQQRICLKTGKEFIQLRHRQPGCSQFVVKDEPNLVTVQYTCPGNGYGRTTIRRESSELVQVSSQGIVNGVPFSFSGEARHQGDC